MDGYWSSALTRSPTPPPPAAAQDGYALDYASDALKADADVVLAAIESVGEGRGGEGCGVSWSAAVGDRAAPRRSLPAPIESARRTRASPPASDWPVSPSPSRSCPPPLSSAQKGDALKVAADALKADKDFVRRAAKVGASDLYWVASELKKDDEFMEEVRGLVEAYEATKRQQQEEAASTAAAAATAIVTAKPEPIELVETAFGLKAAATQVVSIIILMYHLVPFFRCVEWAARAHRPPYTTRQLHRHRLGHPPLTRTPPHPSPYAHPILPTSGKPWAECASTFVGRAFDLPRLGEWRQLRSLTPSIYIYICTCSSIHTRPRTHRHPLPLAPRHASSARPEHELRMAGVRAAGALLPPRAWRLRLHDRRAHPDPEGRAAVRGRSSPAGPKNDKVAVCLLLTTIYYNAIV